MSGFHAVDYVIFVAIFGISIGIGLYHGYRGRRQKTISAYLMADRQLSLIPVTLSMIVSVLSANTLLGVPAETYNYGTQIILKAAGTFIAGGLSGLVFVPLLYPLRITSTYEYLEMRFNSLWVRRLGSVLLIMSQCLYTGCVIIGSAIAFQTAVGLPSWASVLIITVLGSVDTALGGFKGVIWTDVFQSIIMLVGLIIVVVWGTLKVGGITEIWTINKEWGRIFINLDVDPTQRMNLLSGVLGFGTTWWGFYGVSQPQVQRYCAMETKTKGILGILLVPVGFFFFHVLSVFTGLVVAAYYIKKGCDPLRAKYIGNSNQLLIYFVVDAFDVPGLPGAFMSCLFCAALSSQSSSLNSMAAVVWEDFLSKRFSHWSNTKKSYFLRLSVLVLGAVSGFWAMLLLAIGGNLQQLVVSFISISLGPLLGIFLLGAFLPFANSKGAFWGGLVSLILVIWLLCGQIFYRTQRVKLPAPTYNCTDPHGNQLLNVTMTSSPWPSQTSDVYGTTSVTPDDTRDLSGVQWLYSVSFLWYSIISSVTTLLLGSAISLITGCEKGRTIPRRLFSPLIRRYLPEDRDEDESTMKLKPPLEKSADSATTHFLPEKTSKEKPRFR